MNTQEKVEGRRRGGQPIRFQLVRRRNAANIDLQRAIVVEPQGIAIANRKAMKPIIHRQAVLIVYDERPEAAGGRLLAALKSEHVVVRADQSRAVDFRVQDPGHN